LVLLERERDSSVAEPRARRRGADLEALIFGRRERMKASVRARAAAVMAAAVKAVAVKAVVRAGASEAATAMASIAARSGSRRGPGSMGVGRGGGPCSAGSGN
jgi:adenylyl- and sulfurtransferase ThiI